MVNHVLLDRHILSNSIPVKLEFQDGSVELTLGEYVIFPTGDGQLAMIFDEKRGPNLYIPGDKHRPHEWFNAISHVVVHFASGAKRFRVSDREEKGDFLLNDFLVRLELVEL